MQLHQKFRNAFDLSLTLYKRNTWSSKRVLKRGAWVFTADICSLDKGFYRPRPKWPLFHQKMKSKCQTKTFSEATKPICILFLLKKKGGVGWVFTFPNPYQTLEYNRYKKGWKPPWPSNWAKISSIFFSSFNIASLQCCERCTREILFATILH